MKRVLDIILLFLVMLTTLMSACFPKSLQNEQPPQASPTFKEPVIPIENLIEQESSFVPEISSTLQEDKTLTLVLEYYGDRVYPGKYLIVKPYTSPTFEFRDHENEMLRAFNSSDYNFASLIKQILENNQEPHLLTVKSSVEHRYYIDYPGHFAQFLQKYDANVGRNGMNPIQIQLDKQQFQFQLTIQFKDMY
jgi:hypothetical protein